jgi:hypothetical protein
MRICYLDESGDTATLPLAVNGLSVLGARCREPAGPRAARASPLADGQDLRSATATASLPRGGFCRDVSEFESPS